MPAKNSKLVTSRHQYHRNADLKFKLNQDNISESLHESINTQSIKELLNVKLIHIWTNLISSSIIEVRY